MWMFRSLELFLYWLGLSAGRGVTSAGETLADKAIPFGRPTARDKRRTARMLKGDMAELHDLYIRLCQHEAQVEETINNLSWEAVGKVTIHIPKLLENPLLNDAQELCRKLLEFEGYAPIPKIDFASQLPLGQIWDLKKTVQRYLTFYESPKRREEIADILMLFLYNIFHKDILPDAVFDGKSEEMAFSVPFYNFYTDTAQAIEFVCGVVFRTPEDDGTFSNLMKKFKYNLAVIDPVKEVWPTQIRDRNPAELIETYLNGTPFLDFLQMNLPFTIPEDSRFEHMHIVAGSGHGKTQTLQNFILSDLRKIRNGQRTVIVIDSQGDIIKNILMLEAIGDLSDRVVLINPRDLKYPPALNLFDIGLDRVRQYNEVEQEMLINGAIDLYEYIFGAVLGADLTAKQGVIFGYLARLMMVVPGATIITLRDFMQDPELVREYLGELDDPDTRAFFETHFFSKDFNDTRQQILYRIFAVLKTSALGRMFRNKRNKLDLYEAMNRGSLILISTAKDLLKQEGSRILGRFFIALIAQAAQERQSIPRESRMPTFVYIDEAHEYFDKSIETLLTESRKFKVGLCLSHQFLDQFDKRLHSAVKTNTAIKLVGGLSYDDAGVFANEMGCTREFLQSMHKGEGYTQFACSVKDKFRPLRLTIPLGMMEDLPKINPPLLRDILQRNRELYCRDATEEQGPPDPDTPDDDSPLGDPYLL